jgi:hypothetical protein
MIRQSWWVRLVLGLFAVPLLVGTGLAQGPILRGQVVDPDGLPVTGITVSLHHVTDSGGSEVGRAVSDQEGRFEIALVGEGNGGVYFAATRFDGTLYMGEPFRTLAEASADYRILIGAGGITGGSAAGPALQPPGSPGDRQGRGAVALLLAAIGIAVVLFPLLRLRRGPLAVRTVLAELAELEEAHASRPGGPAAGTEAEYLAARAALHSRLRALSRPRVNAADLH